VFGWASKSIFAKKNQKPTKEVGCVPAPLEKQLSPSTELTSPHDLLPPAIGARLSSKLLACHWL
jgi:hypothetical protein